MHHVQSWTVGPFTTSSSLLVCSSKDFFQEDISKRLYRLQNIEEVTNVVVQGTTSRGTVIGVIVKSKHFMRFILPRMTKCAITVNDIDIFVYICIVLSRHLMSKVQSSCINIAIMSKVFFINTFSYSG